MKELLGLDAMAFINVATIQTLCSKKLLNYLAHQPDAGFGA